jgi:hypothetical protein
VVANELHAKQLSIVALVGHLQLNDSRWGWGEEEAV